MNIDYQMKQMVNIFGEERVRDSLKNLAEIEADKCRFKIQKVRQKLAVYEDRYHKNSENAWEEYHQGRLGDDTDIMEWMAFYENLLDFQDEGLKNYGTDTDRKCIDLERGCGLSENS